MGSPQKTVRTISRYTGSTQHTRVITAEQFNRDHFSAMEQDLVWDAANRWTVDVTDIGTPELLEYLKSDPDFSIREQEMLVKELNALVKEDEDPNTEGDPLQDAIVEAFDEADPDTDDQPGS